MRNIYLARIFFFISFLSLFSCSDEEDIDEQENIVTFKVYSNSPNEPIILMGCCEGPYIIIRGSWKRTVKTKSSVAQIEAECEDAHTIITGEIYVNRKLKKKSEGNRYIKLATPIKGHPYGY